MNIQEAKTVIQAGFAWGNWTDYQKEAFKIAWGCMTKCQQKEAKSEGLISSLRRYHQINVYTVSENWCIQLFDLDVDTNDIEASCIYEDQNKDLDNLLIEAIEWVNRNREI
ncbi:hypothetical protein JOC94_002345 [Bacillus thermophilus]|uniref:Phage protein n=1 Tax=Siminovitchia thermophila TaxID=1245522 RepID=A0ABS2R6V8_9BACI|nr:hypothetical protein [Siminovitchia thermophila]MBM7715358.1 hypothetical protein [Siminovitchia thermophila]